MEMSMAANGVIIITSPTALLNHGLGKSEIDVSPSSATCAETPSTVHSNSPDSTLKVTVLEDQPSATDKNVETKLTTPIRESVGVSSMIRKFESKKALNMETPPRLQSTSRMGMLLSRMQQEIPSCSGTQTAATNNSQGEDTLVHNAQAGFNSPTKANKKTIVRNEDDEMGYIKPSSLFQESSSSKGGVISKTPESEPGHLTPQKATDSSGIKPSSLFQESSSSKGGVISMTPESEPGHLTPQRGNSSSGNTYTMPYFLPPSSPKALADNNSVSGSSDCPFPYFLPPSSPKALADNNSVSGSSDCPFDCIEDYRNDSFPASCPPTPEVKDKSNEATTKKSSKSYTAVRSSLRLLFGISSGPTSDEILNDLAIGDPLDNSAKKDAELGKLEEKGQDITMASTQSYGSRSIYFDAPSDPTFSGIDKSLSCKTAADRPKRKWCKILFYLAVTVVLIVIVAISSLLLVRGTDGFKIAALEDGSDSSSPGAEGDSSSPAAEGYFFSPGTEGDSSSPAAEGDSLSPGTEGDLELPAAEGDLELPGAEEDSDGGGFFDESDGSGGFNTGAFFELSNQACTNAVPLEGILGMYNDSTKNATWNDNQDICSDAMSVGYGAWYSFQVEESILIEASTCVDTNFDTQITIASGNCNGLQCVTFNDEACGAQSRATWYAEAGTTYYILVHGFREAQGDFVLTMKPAENNDQCDDAKGPITVGSIMSGTTTGASNDDAPMCSDVDRTKPGVWYTLDNEEGWLRAEVINRGFNFQGQVSVYSGTGCSELSCEVGSKSGSVSWKAESAQTYYVFVNGLSDEGGDFDLHVSWDRQQDTCDDAIPFFVSDVGFGSTSQARPNSVQSCGTTGFHTAPGLWFSVPGNGKDLAASTCSEGSELDTQISVFQGGCDALECIAGTGQGLPCDDDGAVTWASEVGKEYIIFISGRGSRVGDFWLTVDDNWLTVDEAEADEEGVVCASPMSLSPSGSLVLGSTTDALVGSARVCGDIGTSKGVWYEVEGTGQMVTVSACDDATTFDARLSLFTGTCDNLDCVAHTSSSCGESDSIQFTSMLGSMFYLFVHGPDETAVGDFALSMEEGQLNDSCDLSLPVDTRTNSYFGSTQDATLGVQINSCEKRASATYGLWYTLVGTGSIVTLSTCSEQNEIDADIAVFTGSCSDLACLISAKDGCDDRNAVMWLTEPDVVYYVQIRGANPSEVGNFVMDVAVKNPNPFFGT
jgi:hypothetical protein